MRSPGTWETHHAYINHTPRKSLLGEQFVVKSDLARFAIAKEPGSLARGRGTRIPSLESNRLTIRSASGNLGAKIDVQATVGSDLACMMVEKTH
jgi:hypothetical protein